MIYIIDSYSWIENLEGTDKGTKLEKMFENSNDKFITMECSLSEIYGNCLKKDKNFSEVFRIIKANSVILPVMKEHWLEAARIKHEMRKTKDNFGIMDSILLAKQKEIECKIITGDTHFKGLKNIVYIG